MVPLPEISSKSKKVLKVYDMSHKGVNEERHGLPDQFRDEDLGDRSYTPSYNLVQKKPQVYAFSAKRHKDVWDIPEG